MQVRSLCVLQVAGMCMKRQPAQLKPTRLVALNVQLGSYDTNCRASVGKHKAGMYA